MHSMSHAQDHPHVHAACEGQQAVPGASCSSNLPFVSQFIEIPGALMFSPNIRSGLHSWECTSSSTSSMESRRSFNTTSGSR
jgi:hypothetical protein